MGALANDGSSLEVLIMNGADISIKDKYGKTALNYIGR